MNNIQQLVIDKVKALSLNQQKTVLYFIDQLLTPNVIDSAQKLEALLMEGVNSLEREIYQQGRMQKISQLGW